MTHHLLTSTDYEEGRECEVEHLTECKTSLNRGYLEWGCAVGQYLAEAGLPDERTCLPEGEYPIEFWLESRRNYTGALEHEYGVALVTE